MFSILKSHRCRLLKDRASVNIYRQIEIYKTHIPNIYALNSDTHTLRIQYEYTQTQCVGVAIEGMDIWYMGLTVYQFKMEMASTVFLQMG